MYRNESTLTTEMLAGQNVRKDHLSIAAAVEYLSGRNERMEFLVNELRSRLSPLLAAASETAAGGQLRSAPACPLEGALRDQAARLENSCEALAEMLGLLQV